MVPWPIALLTLLYGAAATLSAATACKIIMGVSAQSLAWSLVWLMASGAATIGLALLRPWGRHMAMACAWLFLGTTLAVAALLVRLGHPVIGLVAAMSAAVHVVIIQYLRRSAVKKLFLRGGTEEC